MESLESLAHADVNEERSNLLKDSKSLIPSFRNIHNETILGFDYWTGDPLNFIVSSNSQLKSVKTMCVYAILMLDHMHVHYLCRVNAMAAFISFIAKFCPMQFLHNVKTYQENQLTLHFTAVVCSDFKTLRHRSTHQSPTHTCMSVCIYTIHTVFGQCVDASIHSCSHPIYLGICPSIHPSVHPSISPPVHPCFHPSPNPLIKPPTWSLI